MAALVAAAAGLFAFGSPAVAAQAAPPGAGGPIAFSVDTRDGGACCRLNIATMRPDGSGIRLLTSVKLGNFAQHPAWSPSRASIVYGRSPSGSLGTTQIWTVNADGSDQRLLVADPFYQDFEPSYSPDGRHIVFVRCRPDFSACGISRVDAQGRHLSTVLPLRTGINSFQPTYSPNGAQIAFNSYGLAGVTGAVYVMRSDGSGVRRVTPGWLGAATHDWSPDGRHIVIQSNCCTPRHAAIWQVDIGTGALRQLTTPGARHDFFPSYSPDGTRVAFERDAPDFSGFAVWVMNADGTHQHKVGPALSGEPDWGSAR